MKTISNSYYVFEITESDESAEALHHFMFSIDAFGIEEIEKGFRAYFLGNVDVKKIEYKIEHFRIILEHAELKSDFQYDIYKIPKKDWSSEWKKGLTPIEIGDELIVLTPWHKYKGPREKIIIEPEMAFGTGHHATTELCLKTICELSDEKTGSFLDIGTGTGILAIAACKLGFNPIYATEIDKIAVDIARKNFIINEISHVTFIDPELLTLKRKLSLIVCNLTQGSILKLLDRIVKLVEHDGNILLCGILSEQKNDILSALKNKYINHKKIIEEDGWVLIII